MDPRQDIAGLMAVRVQGISSPERFAAAIGAPPAHAEERAAALRGAGLATQRSGGVTGLAITPAGAEALADALEAEGLRGDESLGLAYERFCDLNERLLRVASDWQVRRHGSIEQPNDHGDPDYDHQVIERLFELHDGAAMVLRRLSKRAPRFGPYRTRLDACVERLQGGDQTAFTAVMADSYHTVWFELHQDLLLTLDLQRES